MAKVNLTKTEEDQLRSITRAVLLRSTRTETFVSDYKVAIMKVVRPILRGAERLDEQHTIVEDKQREKERLIREHMKKVRKQNRDKK